MQGPTRKNEAVYVVLFDYARDSEHLFSLKVKELKKNW